MAATSWATARLETVARPRWLSGTRKASHTPARASIWRRTRSRSGRNGGSISHRTQKPAWSRKLTGGGLDSATGAPAAQPPSGPEQLGHRPRLEGTARGGVRRVALGRLAHRSESPLAEVQLEPVGDAGGVGAG